MVERRLKTRGTCESLTNSGRKRGLEGARAGTYERFGWATRLRKSGRKRKLEGALKRDYRESVLGGLLG